MRTRIVMLMLAGLLPALATDNVVVIKGGLISPQGDARDLTHTSKGYTLEMGLRMVPEIWGGTVAFMPYAGLVKADGDPKFRAWVKYNDGTVGGPLPAGNYTPGVISTIVDQKYTYNLRGDYAGFDVIYKPWSNLPVHIHTGPILTQYFIERLQPYEVPMGDATTKIGWRVGATYDLDKQWQIGVAFTQTEWHSRSKAVLPYEQGFNPSRPAYLSFTASYGF